MFIKAGLALDVKLSVYIWIAPLESCAYKSLDYIIQIFNSQHGWIFIMVINSQYYDGGLQSRFSAMVIILLMDMIYFYNGGNSPESLQAYDRALGGYIIQIEIHQICKSHVTASMHHGTWGLMQSHFFHHLIEDPTRHIVMSRPLGATNCSCQQFKVHKS